MISVVIPYFNNLKILKPTCLSVIRKSPKNAEIILVNDASTDGTDKKIKKFLKYYKKKKKNKIP